MTRMDSFTACSIVEGFDGGAKISAGKKGKPWSPARRAAFAQNKIRDMAAELRELRGETRPEPDAPCVVLPFPNKAAKRRAA